MYIYVYEANYKMGRTWDIFKARKRMILLTNSYGSPLG